MKVINRSSFLFLIVTFSIVAILYFQGSTILSTLAGTNVKLLIFLIILNIPYIAIGGYAFDILCRPYHIFLRWQDWFGLSFIANLMNQLLPYRPGMGFRYLYLYRHYKMKFTQFTLIMIIYFIITLATGLLFSAAGWGIKGLGTSYYKMLHLSLWLSITLIIFFVLLKIFPFHYFNSPTLKKIIENVKQAFRLFTKSPKILFISTICIIVMHLNCAVLLFFSFKALNSQIPLLHCIFLTGLLSIAMIFPVTPGNIGVLEALMGTLTQLMYNNFTLGFSATALFRASQWVVSLIFGTFFSLKLVGRFFPRYSSKIKFGDEAGVD